MIQLLVCSFVMALVSVTSMNVYRTTFLFGNSVFFSVISIVFLTGITAGIMKVIFHIFSSADRKISISVIADFPGKFNDTRKMFLISFGVILAAWIPYIIAYYPGTSFGDTSTQIEMFLNYIQGKTLLLDHHPVFDTLIFGGFIWMGQQLFDSSNAGCFLFIIIQCIMTAAVFSYSCVFLKRRGIKNFYCFIAVLFFACYPPIPQYAVTMLKDSLYSWIYVLWFVLFLEFVADSLEKMSWKKMWVFFFLSLFCSLTKKTGAYLLIFTAFFLFFYCRKNWKFICTAFLLPALVTVLLIPKVLFPLISCLPGGKQEILGILFQQTAKYVVDHGEEVSKEEREVIDALLNYDTLAERYMLNVQDPVKFESPLYNNYGIQEIDQELFHSYLKTWISQGLKHPLTYIEATLGTCLGYFIPAKALEFFPDSGSGLKEQIIYQPKQLSTIHYYFSEGYNRLSNTWGIRLLFQVVIFSWWIPVFMFWVIFRKRSKNLIMMLPVVGSILLCVLSPCALGRYIMHLLYTAPLIIGIPFFTGKRDEKEKE